MSAKRLTAKELFNRNAERLMKHFDRDKFEDEYPTLLGVVIGTIEQYHQSQQSEKERELYEALESVIEGYSHYRQLFSVYDRNRMFHAKQTIEKHKPNK